MSNVQGMDALMRRMKAIGEPEPLLRALQFETIRIAKSKVHRKTGLLQQRIVPGAINRSSAIVKVNAPYAASVEFGAKPHIIKAKPGKVLAWPATAAGRRLSGRGTAAAKRGSPGLGKGGIKRVGSIGPNSGTYRYAAFVHHPGNKPYPYLIPAAKEAVEGMDETIIAQWNGAA